MIPSHNVLEVELLSPLTVSADRAQQLHEKGSSLPGSCPASRGNVECHRNMLRKMQMSFGGEWNPAALSMGIWKPVTLEYYTVAILRDVDVAINHNDTHWTMDCRAFISTSDSESFYAHMMVYARWAGKLLPSGSVAQFPFPQTQSAVGRTVRGAATAPELCRYEYGISDTYTQESSQTLVAQWLRWAEALRRHFHTADLSQCGWTRAKFSHRITETTEYRFPHHRAGGG